jgi:hypothetical protein
MALALLLSRARAFLKAHHYLGRLPNAFPGPRCDACCQQIASKPQVVVAVALRALLRLAVLGTSLRLERGPAIAGVMWGSNPVPGCSTVRGRDGGRPLTYDAD